MRPIQILKMIGLLVVFSLSSCAEVDDGGLNDVRSEKPLPNNNAQETGTDAPPGTTGDTSSTSGIDSSVGALADPSTNTLADTDALNSIENEVPTEPSPKRTIGDCQVPQRTAYMAQFGVTPADKDLSDPNVLQAKQHTILYIFDKSGSMGGAWNDSGGTKWDVARDAMISGVEPFTEYLSAGAIFFALPHGADDVALMESGKQIDFQLGDDFLDAWEGNMESYAAGGGTPLMEALEVANDAIAYACEQGVLDQPFKVVLITDGAPNFWEPQRGLGLVKSWYDMGIPTTVIGMPGSASASELLADIADIGSGGTMSVEGTVETEGTADEILYDNESTTAEFDGDMVMVAE